MGSDRRRAGAHAGARLLTRIAQVVPDVPSFAVDDGFAYEIPDEMDLQVGHLVRVPLGGRRVRGFVVSVREGEPSRPLKPIAARSGDLPVFDPRLLETLRWAAIYYVAPHAAVLAMAAPPNVPRRRRADEPVGPLGEAEVPGLDVSAVATGAPARWQVYVGRPPWAPVVVAAARPHLREGRNVVVVAPTFEETDALATRLEAVFPDRVERASSQLPAREVTAAWARLNLVGGRILVGTREVATWAARDLGLIVVVEEGRRAMKAPQTPTVHVRDLAFHRSRHEEVPVLVVSQVPTVETLARRPWVHVAPGRAWSLVEVVDRREFPPGSGVITEPVRRAVGGVAKAGGRVLAFVSRRGYAPALRCVACGELRRCTVCGSGVELDGRCRRCGAPHDACVHCGGRRFTPLGIGVGRAVEELARVVGADAVGPVELEVVRPVQVGTERDLVHVDAVDLSVILDGDRLLLAPHYRAEEDALRIMARVAGKVPRGGGRRTMAQTSMPQHRVYEALRHGHGDELLETLLMERTRMGFPPATEMLAIEVADAPAEADADLRKLASDVAVLGPALHRDRQRWLVQGNDLRSFKVLLREVVQRWREQSATVRVDADPIDL